MHTRSPYVSPTQPLQPMPTLLPLCPFFLSSMRGATMWIGYNLARDKDA